MATVAPDRAAQQTTFVRRTHLRVRAWALTALLSPAARRPFTSFPPLMQATAISRHTACANGVFLGRSCVFHQSASPLIG
ncbi:hypothetical protein NP493_545g01095 [Ridgeia piscesae]|uniref:Uncharacterized protein n=1 Tax=Ridgeia piscesae TaxID=27915 RepID=A0AAD9KVH5_RIDPI|nr:hypothetical protein NP493_545g01095 [Ridgeia piscesae]